MTYMAEFNNNYLFLAKHPVKNNEKNKEKSIEAGNQTHQNQVWC
jgi:hypothetical protein